MKTIHCEKEISVGSEHRVYLEEGQKSVIKAPNSFGKFWHRMGANLAERDQILLDLSGIPHIPTAIEEGPLIITLRDGTAREVDYVMKQPYISDAVTLEFSMLQENTDLLNELMEMVEKAEAFFNETHFGVDFVGGQAFVELLLAFFRWEVRGAVYNVLLPQSDQFDADGKKFAEKRHPILCDTRLYDCNGVFLDVFLHVRRNIQHLQTEILHSFLRKLEKGDSGPSRKVQFEILLHRITAWGIRNFVWFRLKRNPKDKT